MLAYLDCFSGVSGDMLLGAIIDAGVEVGALRAGLAGLPLTGYQLVAEPLTASGLHGVRARVVTNHKSPPVERHLADIEGIIDTSQLSESVRRQAKAIFRRLASAEARVHGVDIAQVHFHEVGAVDAIVDVVGTLVGLELLGVDSLCCSELPFTSGRVRSDHGELPVPAPATIELLRGTQAVWHPVAAEGEMVTPTGAAIIASLARFERPTFRIERVGLGFGTRELPWANCLRLLVGADVGESGEASAGFESDLVTVIEANIDTMTGEALGWLMERLFDAGALDVSYAPLTMKKQRPGTHLIVLSHPEGGEAMAELILRESNTLGVRLATTRRLKTSRRVDQIETPLGQARIKAKIIAGKVVSLAAEYEDARTLAAQLGLPLADVVRQLEAAGWERLSGVGAPEEHGDGDEEDGL